MRTRLLLAACASALVAGGCVHQTEPTAIGGPSTFARSITVTATPDRITQDGSSQSSITVDAAGPDGRPLVGVALRLDMAVPCTATQPGCSGGFVQADYGTLSARTVVTGSDGKARAVYTAPAAPSPLQGGSGSVVSIGAMPISNDGTGLRSIVNINLMPPGVILPPADTPTASFKVTPASFTAGVPVLFDGSASCGGALSGGACPSSSSAITSYAWTFGDSSTGTGQSVQHAFATAGSFAVTLTVTNARGVSASTTQSVSPTQTANPVAAFVFSPTAPVVNQTVVFNADASRAAPGRTLVQYSWIFGDGTTGSGFLASHAFAAAGTYNVTLSVLDDGGLKTTLSQSVSVSGGAGSGGAPTAKFTFSPSAPGINQDVFFNASSSTAAGGHSLTSYAWDFGDGSTATGVTVTHPYTRTGTFVVTLVVTDDTNQQATTSASVSVAAASSQIVADFVFSPTDPKITGATNTVFFDATPSSSPAGITSYVWDFGDGTAAGAGQKPQHTFTKAATYVVRLTVTDAQGRTATVTKTVTVGS
jgi:PKD repeat protein